MQRIILISGFGSSGKSTCSQVLWDRLEDVAVVEADHLFRIKPFEMATQEGRDQIGRIKLQNTLAVLKTFLKERYANIIVDGLVWSQDELDAVVEACEDFRCKIYLCWLKTGKEERHKRAIARERDEADSREFLDEVEEKISDPTPLTLPSGHYQEIETDNKTSGEIVDEMLSILQTDL